ncbi:MAG: hypothetical protein IKS13_03725 [Ruminococcus sp.]|nr:hypothetical protein [Ruminococcus sp.]
MNMNDIQKHSTGAYRLLYKLEQLTPEELSTAAPALQYEAPAALANDVKELRGYVRALELSMFPRDLIG